MYNGIGVQTPRGTGTSGYIETSLVSLRPPPMKPTKTQKIVPKQSKALEEHNRRRRVEILCRKFQQKLEKSKMPEDEIKMRVKNYRKSLLNINDNEDKTKQTEQQQKTNESEEIQLTENLNNET